MNLLVIADVHGCYHTLRKLVEEHWEPANELLIQVGDLVNKGPNSAQCVQFWMELEEKHPEKVIMLKGNHEQRFVENLRKKGTYTDKSLRKEFKELGLSPKKARKWMEQLPLKWENDHILITHAGIAKGTSNSYDEESASGVLHNKGPLKDVSKVQVKGHSIVEGHKPVFNPTENAWYIDTGAWTKKYLCALRLDATGQLIKVLRCATDPKDRAESQMVF